MKKISDFLKINNVNMPTPDAGVTIAKNPIWSKNAGRSSNNGKFVGDIVAEKRTVDFKFTGLTSAQVALIESQLTTFYTINFVDPEHPTQRLTIKCYKPPRSYPLKQIKGQSGKFDEFTLNCIEQ